MNNTYLAIDFGGGSGRVIAGQIRDKRLEMEEIHRFPNRQIKLGGHVHWDFLALFEEMKAGICYSTDNQLPNLDDTGSVILTADSKVVSGGQLNVLHSLAAGTYYVRAFAQSEAGVGYSPVLRIVVE